MKIRSFMLLLVLAAIGMCAVPVRAQVEETCRIELCCKNLLLVAWHCYIKCTHIRSDGGILRVEACRGGPTGLFWDLWPEAPDPITGEARNTPPDCPGWTIFDGLLGPIDT